MFSTVLSLTKHTSNGLLNVIGGVNLIYMSYFESSSPNIVSECYMIDEFTCIQPQNMHIILGHDNVNNNGGGH